MPTRAIYCVGLGLILFGCASGIGSGRMTSPQQSSPAPNSNSELASGPDLPAVDGPSLGSPGPTADGGGDQYAARTHLTERTTRLPTAVQRSSGFRGSYRSQPVTTPAVPVNETREPAIGPGKGYVELDPPPEDGI